MKRIKSNAHDSSVCRQDSNSREDPSQGDASERPAGSHQNTPMDELRAIVGKVGGLQEARRLLSDGSQKLPASNPVNHTEKLTPLVQLLAEQHSAQELGKVEDGR